jgi:hypothetical protein
VIVEWLLRLLAWIWEQLLAQVPVVPVPSWFADAGTALTGVTSHIGGLGAWFPFGLLGTVLAAFFTILAVGFSIKILRIIASFLTLGGGQ